MSVCRSFTEHAWKPEACKNCFKPKAQHALGAVFELPSHIMPDDPPVGKSNNSRSSMVLDDHGALTSAMNVEAKMWAFSKPDVSCEARLPSIGKPTIAVRPTLMNLEGKTAAAGGGGAGGAGERGEGEGRNGSASGVEEKDEVFTSKTCFGMEHPGYNNRFDKIHPHEPVPAEALLARSKHCAHFAGGNVKRHIDSHQPIISQYMEECWNNRPCRFATEEAQLRVYDHRALLVPDDQLSGNLAQTIDPQRACNSISDPSSPSLVSHSPQAVCSRSNEASASSEGWQQDYGSIPMPMNTSQLELLDIERQESPEQDGVGVKKWNTVPLGRKSMERVSVFNYDDSYDEILECDMIQPLERMYSDYSLEAPKSSEPLSDCSSESSKGEQGDPYSQPHDAVIMDPPAYEAQSTKPQIRTQKDMEHDVDPDYASISDGEIVESSWQEIDVPDDKPETQKVVLTIHLEGCSRKLTVEDGGSANGLGAVDQEFKPYRVVRSEPVGACKPYTVVDVSAVLSENKANLGAFKPAPTPASPTAKSPGRFYHEMWKACTLNPQFEAASPLRNTQVATDEDSSLVCSAKVSPKPGGLTPEPCEMKFNSYNNAGMPPFPIILHDEPYYAQSSKRKAVKVPIVINPGAYDNLSCYESFIGPGHILIKRDKGKHCASQYFDKVTSGQKQRQQQDGLTVAMKDTGDSSLKEVGALKHVSGPTIDGRPRAIEGGFPASAQGVGHALNGQKEISCKSSVLVPSRMTQQLVCSVSNLPSPTDQPVRSKSFNFPTSKHQNLSVSDDEKDARGDQNTSKVATIRERIEALSLVLGSQSSHLFNQRKQEQSSCASTPSPTSTRQPSSKIKFPAQPIASAKDNAATQNELPSPLSKSKARRKISLKNLFKWWRVEEDTVKAKSPGRQTSCSKAALLESEESSLPTEVCPTGFPKQPRCKEGQNAIACRGRSRFGPGPVHPGSENAKEETSDGVMHRQEDVVKRKPLTVMSDMKDRSNFPAESLGALAVKASLKEGGEAVAGLAERADKTLPSPSGSHQRKSVGFPSPVALGNLDQPRANCIAKKREKQLHQQRGVEDSIAFEGPFEVVHRDDLLCNLGVVAIDASNPPPLPKKQRTLQGGADSDRVTLGLTLLNPLYVMEAMKPSPAVPFKVSRGLRKATKCETWEHLPGSEDNKGSTVSKIVVEGSTEQFVMGKGSASSKETNRSCVKLSEKPMEAQSFPSSPSQKHGSLLCCSVAQLATAEDCATQGLLDEESTENWNIEAGVWGAASPDLEDVSRQGRAEVLDHLGVLYTHTLCILGAHCEEKLLQGQRQNLRFGVDSWSGFKLTSDRPCCNAGDAIYYTATYANDWDNLYAVKICKIEGKDSQQQYYHSLSVRQSLPLNFNVQQDCGHFVADVPRSLLPNYNHSQSEESDKSVGGQSRVVVITREVPRCTVADLVYEGVELHRTLPQQYERQAG
uniref:inactive tyrosine-protein kinase PEAK1-like isoform X2 n=1 Tax=Myxine glutinosa TaxID=7769 RepID=UPI00358FBA8D